MSEYYLVHHGIKGMKWGVRRYQNEDGTLTKAGIKRYATAGYAKDSYRSNKTVAGKVYDAYTGAHKMSAKMKYDSSSDKQNRARAERYLAEKNAKKPITRQKAAKVAAKGATIASQLAMMSLADDIFYYGAGKKAIKATGRLVVSAFMAANGHTNIRWYD